MLTYEVYVDVVNEYSWNVENITMESLKRFIVAICGCFENVYFPQPAWEGIEHIFRLIFNVVSLICLGALNTCISSGKIVI
jgi:CO dehydrogenase/acetyl-CoA synthase beta subunit